MYTRRTLTKVMENIPLYLDLTTCRQGIGERQTSLEWNDPDQVGLHAFSLFFYPSGIYIGKV
jgi:hypothetical protein